MAFFEKRSGSWRVVVRRDGKRESKTFPTKAQAAAWAIQRESELDDVAAGGVPRKTLRETLRRYLEEVAPKHRGFKWEDTRVGGWLGRIDRRTGETSKLMLPWLDKQLSEISRSDLAEWRNRRLETVSPGSVLREMNLLGSVFNVAVNEFGWLKVSPLKTVERPKSPAHRTRRISAEEIDALSVALGWDERPVETLMGEVAAAFLLAIETAMRQGEILSLSWLNIDFARQVAHIPMTKNGSRRDVPLSSRALQILELMRGRSGDRVFSVSSASADALFRKAKAFAKIEDLHFHDTRREATSRLAQKVDVLTLARITGHRDIRMLMIYYQTDMAAVAKVLG